MEERCAVVGSIADWFSAQYGEAGKETWLKRLIVEEVGKPLEEADVEVIETSDFIRYYARVGPSVLKSVSLELDNSLWPTKTAKLSWEPIGVIGIIKPWNYPIEMIAWSLGPALVAGNACVIKPSEKSSACGDVFARMAADVDLPAGLINIVYGEASAGVCLTKPPKVGMVSFTGSLRAGRHVAHACADRLARVSLELSGNDAAIVLEDADLETAANGVDGDPYSGSRVPFSICILIKLVPTATVYLRRASEG